MDYVFKIRNIKFFIYSHIDLLIILSKDNDDDVVVEWMGAEGKR